MTAKCLANPKFQSHPTMQIFYFSMAGGKVGGDVYSVYFRPAPRLRAHIIAVAAAHSQPKRNRKRRCHKHRLLSSSTVVKQPSQKPPGQSLIYSDFMDSAREASRSARNSLPSYQFGHCPLLASCRPKRWKINKSWLMPRKSHQSPYSSAGLW